MENKTAWDVVKIARDPRRLTCMDYIENVFDDFFELHGDRLYGDDPAVVTGMAHIEGHPVMLVCQNRGKPGKDAIERNYGMPKPEGYRKAQRVSELASRFDIPIIDLVDTPGAHVDVESEYRGQANAIAQSIYKQLGYQSKTISIVIGQGGSGGALAMAVADYVYMLKYATYSILSPEGFASILYKDVQRANEVAEKMKMTSEDLLELNAIDGIIDEADEGNWIDPELTYRSMKKAILSALEDYQNFSREEWLKLRKYRFRNF